MIGRPLTILMPERFHEAHLRGLQRYLASREPRVIGKTVELEVMDTPGHTMCHVCLRSHTDQPALFCGDTLFAAGCGRLFEGTPRQMHDSLSRLMRLPDSTHDY